MTVGASKDEWLPVDSGTSDDTWVPVGSDAGAPTAAAAADSPALTNNVQSTGAERYLFGSGSELLKGLAHGIGLPGDLETGGRWAINKVGGDVSPVPFFPTTRTLQNDLGHLGLVNRSNLIPGFDPEHAAAERIGATTMQGLGSAIPQAGITAATGGIGAALPVLAAGAAGGLAGGAVHEVLPNGSGAETTAGFLTGAGVQGLASKFATNTVKSVAKSLGSSKTLQEGGEALQDAARTWRTVDMPAKEAEAWAPVDAAIPATAPTDLHHFATALDDISKSAPSLQPLADRLSKRLPAQLLDDLNNKTLVGLGAPAPWADVRTIRSMLGDAKSDPKLIQDIGEQNINKLYAAITQDLNVTASVHGAGDAFAAANAESTRLRGIADGPMSAIIKSPKEGAEGIKPEDAAARLLSGGKRGGTDLATLRQEIPEGLDELAASHLQTTPNAWAKLSPEAKEALVTDKSARKKLDRAMPPSAPPAPPEGSIGGLLLGEAAGNLAGHLMSQHLSPEAGTVLGAAVGYGYPLVKHGVKNLLTHPGLPFAGAVGGSNALFPSPLSPVPGATP